MKLHEVIHSYRAVLLGMETAHAVWFIRRRFNSQRVSFVQIIAAMLDVGLDVSEQRIVLAEEKP